MFLAVRLPAVEMVNAEPTQMIITMIANPPTTSPMFTRRLVRWASQRWVNAPNANVMATTTITDAGILVDAVVSASTRADVAS